MDSSDSSSSGFGSDAIPGGAPRVVVSGGRVRRFRPLVVIRAIALGLAATAGLGALAFAVPIAVGAPVLAAGLAGFGVWHAMRRSPRVGAETRRALAAFTKPHRQLRYAGGEVLARGRVHGAEVVVDPDALRFPVRGFDAFDWPPTPSRVEYDTWKALALLGKRGLARVDALLADVVAASPGADAVIRDGHLVIRFSGAITPVDVERAAERAARRVADLDRLGLVGKDPVALAADAVTGRDMPDELRRALFDGLATFHRHDEATRAAAARLLDHRDARLARAAAELLADEEAAARIDARAGGLALATTEDGRLSVAEDAEEMSAPARSE